MDAKKQETTKSNSVKERRTFVKKAMAGSVLVSLPLKGVWAGNHGNVGVNTSAAASGNGSGGSSVQSWNLEGYDYWKYRLPSHCNYSDFKDVFGVKAYKGYSYDYYPQSNQYGSWYTFNESIYKVMKPERNKYVGPTNYNRLLIALYLNASEHGKNGIYFPIVDGVNYSSATEFARELVSWSYSNPGHWAPKFASFIDDPASFFS